MCDCCKKIIVEVAEPGPTGPTGPQGTSGNVGTYFQAFGETPLTDGSTLFTFTITLAGNYILQYEAYLVKDTSTSVSSRLTKNGSYQSLNTNNVHKTTAPTSIAEITYTHTAKLNSLIVGDVVGYNVFCNTGGLAMATNSSLTLIKVS